MIDGMKWDNPNNCCQSLRLIAEMVRRGEIDCSRLTGSQGAATIRLAQKHQKARER